MEVIKWVLAAIAGLVVTLVGVSLAIGAMIFTTVIQLLGLFAIVASGIAVMVKEKIDERNNK